MCLNANYCAQCLTSSDPDCYASRAEGDKNNLHKHAKERPKLAELLMGETQATKPNTKSQHEDPEKADQPQPKR